MANKIIPLILVALASILSVVLFRAIKEKNNNIDDNSWEASYKKASDFIDKLNRTERVNLLFGTQNM